MKAAYIAEALRGRPSGRGWMARCPAHRDRDPSLSIRELDGRVLVHCFAGCRQEAVIAALRELGVWPEPQRQSWTPVERREYFRRRACAELRAEEVVLWHAAIIRGLEQTKAAAYAAYVSDPDPKAEQALADAARHLLSQTSLHGAALIAEFDAAIDLDPLYAHRIIAQQRAHETEVRHCTAILVAVLALAERGGDE